MKFSSTVLLTITVLFLQSSARADALENWKPSQIITNPVGFNGFALSGLTYGNGRYIAVGQYWGDDNGVIETSEDGINWTLRTSQNYSILDLYDVTFGNGTFVAVGWGGLGNYCLYSSTNGIDWPSKTNGLISNFYRVIYGGGLFVAVGDGNLWAGGTTNRNIYTSPNGINWTARNSGSPASDVHPISDVAYGGDQFVARDDQGYFYNSFTGTTWTRTFNGNSGSSVSYCNGLFIAPSGPGTNLISTNGFTWTSLPNNTASYFGRVVYGNGSYVALSASNIFTSLDGTNWIQRTLNAPLNANLSTVAFGNRNVLALGYTYPPLPARPIAFVSDPFVDLVINSGATPQLSISGLQGRTYRIDYLDGLQTITNAWQTLTTFSLTNSPLLWTDTTTTNSQRFYRAVLLP